MKKMYIITRHFISNYGSLLQTIASVEFFKKYNFDIEVIDYISKKESNWKVAGYVSKKSSSNIFKRFIYFWLRYPDYYISYLRFRKYQKKYLPLTKKINTITNDSFDNNAIFCSGSDQLFGYMPYGGLDLNYFLNFTNSKNKYSFSSSFGRTDFDAGTKEMFIKELKKYNLVTVREESGYNLVKEYLPSDKLFNVLDPTILIPIKYWYNFCDRVKIKFEKYILVYNLHTNKNVEALAKKIAELYDLRIIRVAQYFSSIRLKGKKKILVDPEYFVALFKNATFVVTDSFHGLMFSIIFRKNFYIVNPGKTNSRIIDFLRLIHCENRYIDSSSCSLKMNESINYDEVHKILDDKRDLDTQIFDSNFKGSMTHENT